MPKKLAHLETTLPEGTPVTLLSVQDVRSSGPQSAMPVTFVLANDLVADGVTEAKAGARVTGEVTSTAAEGTAGSMRISIQNVHLEIGDMDIPLRSTARKGESGALDYRWIEDTGRMALTLYVAKDVKLKMSH